MQDILLQPRALLQRMTSAVIPQSRLWIRDLKKFQKKMWFEFNERNVEIAKATDTQLHFICCCAVLFIKMRDKCTKNRSISKMCEEEIQV